MAWSRVDDEFSEHRKVEQLLEADEMNGLAALGLWVLSLSASARRDTAGRVSSRLVRQLAPEHGPQLAALLADCGLYDKAGGGFQIHDFTEYNPTAQRRAEIARARSEAGRAGAAARWAKNGNADGKGHGKSHGNGDGSESAAPVGNGDGNADAPYPPPFPSPIPHLPSPVVADDSGSPTPDLAEHIAGVLQRGIDGLPDDTATGRPPTREAIRAALDEHRPSDDTALAVAVEVRAIVQSQGKAPNVAGLFARRLAGRAAA